MKKSKILLCLGLGALLSSTALMSSPKQNELELKGLNVEKVVGVQKEGEALKRTLSVHFRLDSGSYEGLYAYMWGDTSSTNTTIEFTSSNSYLDGYGITLNVDLTTAATGFDTETSFGLILKYGAGWDNKIGGDRKFTVPESFTDGKYDVYAYNDNNTIYSKDDASGKNYIEWMTRNSIESMTTKAQLSYSYEKTGEDYSFSNMVINFGAIIKKEYFDNLIHCGKNITHLVVGVLKKSDYLADTAEDKSPKGSVYSEKSYVKLAGQDKAFDYSSLVSTDETGTANGGDYVMFSANLKYPAGTSFYNEVIYSVAYIEFDESGKKGAAMLKEKECSVSSLADEYIASSEFTTFSASIQASLQALGALND